MVACFHLFFHFCHQYLAHNCLEEGSSLAIVYRISVLPDEESLLAGSSAHGGKG